MSAPEETREEWESKIVEYMERIGELTTSDAQSILEAHSFKVTQMWGKAFQPAYAGLILLNQ